MRKTFFCLFLLSTTFAWSQIEECTTLFEVKNHATKDTLVIFDLDNTLIRPKQMLGSDEWFRFYLNKKTSEYNDHKKALNEVLSLWEAIQTLSPMRFVESRTKDLIEDLQKKDIPLMVLTTRDHGFARVSLAQLRAHQLDFTKAPPVKGFFRINEMPDVTYDNGILYSDGYHKGNALLHFFKYSSFRPKKVIFIDDKLSWVTQLNILESEGIEYLGLRYAGADRDVSNFDSDVAERQLQHLMSIFHDERIDEPVAQTR